MKVKVLKNNSFSDTYGVIRDFGDGLEIAHSSTPQLFESDATKDDLISIYKTADAQKVVNALREDYDLIEMNMSEPTGLRKRTPKTETQKREFSFMDEILAEMERRPWYEKVYAAYRSMVWYVQSTLSHIIGLNPYHQRGASEAAFMIKDDIEFGYDLNMIYYKIMHGNYGNKALPKKKDWFAKHNLHWDFFLDRQGGVAVLTELKSELEITGDLRTKEDILNWVKTQLDNYYSEKRVRMEAAGIKVEDETEE